MRKNIFTLLIAFLAGISMLRAEISSGACGENLNWSLHTETGVLDIIGSGDMWNYEQDFYGPTAPWGNEITAVNFPEGLTHVGNFAFQHCYDLMSVVIPDSVVSIGEGAFWQCSWATNSSNWQEEHPGLTFVTIGSGVTNIGAGAFGECHLDTIICLSINPPALAVANLLMPPVFDYVYNTLLCVPTGRVGIYKSAPGWGEFINVQTLDGQTENDTLSYCGGNLTWKVVNDSLIIAGTGDMWDYINTPAPWGTAINYASLPEGLTKIGGGAFYSCANLTSLTIPDSVNNIGDGAFSECSGLTSITCEAIVPPYLEDFVFDYVDKSTCTLYVPAESLAAYQTADVWKDFGNVLPIGEEQPIEPTGYEYNVLYIIQDGDSISSEPVTLHLPAAPTIEGFTFLKWQVVAGDLEDGIIIQAIYQAAEPTSAPAVYTNPANTAQKLIRNGHVYILTEEKVYTITGQEVK